MVRPAWSQVRKNGRCAVDVLHDDRVRLIGGEELEWRRFGRAMGVHRLPFVCGDRCMALGSRGANPRPQDRNLSRERAFDSSRTALLIVDVQNATFNDAQREIRPEFFAAARDIVIPNLVASIAACRRRGVEVVYTVIENLTRDGRDRSLDYKLSDFFIAKGSREARVLDAHRARRGRDRHPQNVVERLQLDEYRLRAPQPRRGRPGRDRLPDRPVHRPHGEGRRRPGLLRHLPLGRLHGEHMGAASRGARDVFRLLPDDDDGRVAAARRDLIGLRVEVALLGFRKLRRPF